MSKLKKRTLKVQDQNDLRSYPMLRGFYSKQHEHVKQETSKEKNVDS